MKRGKTLNIHGAFKSKTKAKSKEKKVHGFILERKIKGSKRYIVMTKKKK